MKFKLHVGTCPDTAKKHDAVDAFEAMPFAWNLLYQVVSPALRFLGQP